MSRPFRILLDRMSPASRARGEARTREMLAADEGSPLPFVARWEALERAHRREIRRKRLLIAALWALFMALVGIAQVWPSHAATASAFLSGGALLGVSLRRLLP